MFRNEGRHADTQIDIEPILDLLGYASGDVMALGVCRAFLGRNLVVRCICGERDDFNELFRGGGDDAVDVDAW